MDDLIRRQWLMECVNEGWIKFDTEKDENIFIHLVRDIAPSAQPERWIPCSERMPEIKDNMAKKVIVTTSWNTVSEAYYCVDHWEMNDFDYKLSSVIAWMPLPESWKGESDG